MKILLTVLVFYFAGLLGNSLYIVYGEDAFGCRAKGGSLFSCAWSPGVSENPYYNTYLRRSALWPIDIYLYLVQVRTAATED